ncbi:Mitochondrial distribution and morphology protein 10 [Xanthoria calcicola]
MLDFMDYVQNAFYEASHWNRNNSYGTLTATSQALLDFPTPLGVRLHISSLSTPHFASSYTLASTGLLSGSLSYLYTSLPLPSLPTATRSLPLPAFTPTSYRQLQRLRPPDPAWWWETWHAGRRIDTRDALLYGRLYLPHSTLEACYLRRLTPTRQLKISAVSDARLPNGGSVLALLAQDHGKWSAEYMYSTDSALLGVRGLYNFGPDPRDRDAGTIPSPVMHELAGDEKTSVLAEPAEPVSRFSAGAEVYYGLLNKSGGMSTGIRFATLAAHTGFPYTMTVTLNPLMGNLSSSYSVRAGELLSLSSRFDFNVYSYESDVVMGMELWKLRERDGAGGVIKGEGKEGEDSKMLERRAGEREESAGGDVAGCLKARIDQRGSVGLLWEGRVKELVYSCGTSIDLRGGKDLITGVGLEVQYSS